MKHGRRGLARLLLGTIAEGGMRRAPCPVITWNTLWQLSSPQSKRLWQWFDPGVWLQNVDL